MVGELVEFEEGRKYISSNLESNNFGVVLMADSLMRKERSSIKATWKTAKIPVSETM